MSDSNSMNLHGSVPISRVSSSDTTISNASTSTSSSCPLPRRSDDIVDTGDSQYLQQHTIQPSSGQPSDNHPTSNPQPSQAVEGYDPHREAEPVGDEEPIADQDEHAREDESRPNYRNRITVVAPDAVGQVKKSKTDELIDRQERAIAALLTRFKNLVLLAALPTEDAFTKETAAAEGLRMEVESNALVNSYSFHIILSSPCNIWI